MKKLLAFLLVAVLVVSMGICVVSAAPSIEAEGIISGVTAKDSNDQEVDITFEPKDVNVDKTLYEALKGLKGETGDESLRIVGHYDVNIKGKPAYPVNVILDVLGISKASKVFVLLQKGKEVVSVTPTVKNGKIIFDLDGKYDTLAIVTDGKTANRVEKENGVLSPQTADSTPYVVVIMSVVALAFVFVSKKVKA